MRTQNLQRDVKLEQVVKTEDAPADDCSLAPTLLDAGSQTCKDEPQDFTEDAMPSAQVFTQSVPSLSPVSSVDSRSLSPPPGQTLYRVTPTVPCMRESDLSVDILSRAPGTSLGVISHDSFSPGFSISTPEARLLPLPLTVFPQLFLMSLPFTYLRLHPHQSWSLFPHHHLVLPPRPLLSHPLAMRMMIVPPFPGLGVTFLPGLIFWFVSLSTSLSSPPGLSLFMSLTPSLLFPRPRLVPFPVPRWRPSPPLLPSCWNPQSPLHPPAPVSSSPATFWYASWGRLGQTPRYPYSLSSPDPSWLPPFWHAYPSFLLLPAPQWSPLSLSTGPRPFAPTLLPSPATSLPADSPPISPLPHLLPSRYTFYIWPWSITFSLYAFTTQETSSLDVESCRSWHGSWQLDWLTIGFRITFHFWVRFLSSAYAWIGTSSAS